MRNRQIACVVSPLSLLVQQVERDPHLVVAARVGTGDAVLQGDRGIPLPRGTPFQDLEGGRVLFYGRFVLLEAQECLSQTRSEAWAQKGSHLVPRRGILNWTMDTLLR